MEEEIWKDIPNYNGYQVSNLGRVRTYNKITHTERHGDRHWKDRILKQKIQERKNGRKDYRVELWNKKGHKTFLVARLVAFTFYNEDINNTKLTVDHIDGNSLNNNIKNLELVSIKENIQRGFKNGLYKNQKKIKLQYKDCGKPIYCNSMSEASRILGYKNGYISNRIQKGKFENKEAMWKIIN